MNVKNIVAAATIAFVGASAFAQEGVKWPDESVVSTRSRAEVQAELAKARADGTPFRSGEARWLPEVGQQPANAAERYSSAASVVEPSYLDGGAATDTVRPARPDFAPSYLGSETRRTQSVTEPTYAGSTQAAFGPSYLGS